MSSPTLAIILPCYNEQEALSHTSVVLNELMQRLMQTGSIAADSFVLFVDDGSKDKTWTMIAGLHGQNRMFRGLKLSTNFGHQNALLAGMHAVNGQVDCAITIDADLQDDPATIEKMIEDFRNGSAIVYGVRSSRDKDSFFKKITARFFYRLLKFMKVKTVYDHADFRLMSRQVISEICRFKEVNLYLRGIFPMMGFPSSIVYYERKERIAGTTKYPLRKMMSFAWEGITSFSTFPLRLIFLLGFLIFIISIVLMVWAFIPVLDHKAVPGWASTVLPILFFGGLQMISLGIIGEYLGKIYHEVKERPRFIIEKELN